MAIFSRNSNEDAYVGGRKHWTDVIKNSGSGELLIWRQLEEDFNTNSTLIVMPGEQAIFVRGGVIEQVFDNGTYTLTTNNYPFISRLRNAFSGGTSTFNCVVYFVKVSSSVEINWGTSSPIQVRDKLLGIATKIKTRGSYKVQITNPSIFLTKLVGNNISFQTQEDLNKFFMNEFQSKIRSVITDVLNKIDVELLGIESRLDELSNIVEPSINDILQEYGIKCIRFIISAMEIDDDELRKKYDELGMDQIAILRKAQAEKGAIDILGQNWGRVQAKEILTDVANNPGAGGTAAAGAGLGMGFASASVFGNMATQMFEPMNSQPQQPQQTTQADRFSSKGINNVPGSQAAEAKQDPFEALTTLKKMLDAGLIDQSEYNMNKEAIMKKMRGE